MLSLRGLFFSILAPVVKQSFIFCESLLDWHSTLPEVLDLTPPCADYLACSGFLVPTWRILLTGLNISRIIV